MEAYVSEYHHKIMAWKMVLTYLHFRILEFPLMISVMYMMICPEQYMQCNNDDIDIY